MELGEVGGQGRGIELPGMGMRRSEVSETLSGGRQTNTDVADSASGSASVPTRRTDVPRGAAPGRTATA